MREGGREGGKTDVKSCSINKQLSNCVFNVYCIKSLQTH